MTDKLLINKIQGLLAENRLEDAINLIFDSYQAEHPQARNIKLYRDKISYKLKTEFARPNPDYPDQPKLLLYTFMSIIGESEGETAFNLILLLLHLLRRGHHKCLSEFIEILKLEKASANLNAPTASGNGNSR